MLHKKPSLTYRTIFFNTMKNKSKSVFLPCYKLAVVAAAVCRIYQLGVHSEDPTPRQIYVGRLLNVHNVVGPGTWQVEEMANVSSIET